MKRLLFSFLSSFFERLAWQEFAKGFINLCKMKASWDTPNAYLAEIANIIHILFKAISKLESFPVPCQGTCKNAFNSKKNFDSSLRLSFNRRKDHYHTQDSKKIFPRRRQKAEIYFFFFAPYLLLVPYIPQFKGYLTQGIFLFFKKIPPPPPPFQASTDERPYRQKKEQRSDLRTVKTFFLSICQEEDEAFICTEAK